MSKKWGRFARKGMSVALTAALLLVGVPENTVQAAGRIKLSAKKLTLLRGKSKTIRLKNAKKKVKWKIISGKSVIKLSKMKKIK
jgi:hypothetical protein